MSTRRQEVLKGKKLCLLRTLLLEAGHDVSLVDQLTHGFDLTGMLPESNIFAKRVRPAVIFLVLNLVDWRGLLCASFGRQRQQME